MSVRELRLWNLLNLATVTTVNAQVLDASNDGIAFILRAPKAGTINAIGCNVTARVGTTPIYRFSLQTPIATRTPNGTILEAGAAFVDSAPSATGWRWETLGTGAVVTARQLIAARIAYQADSGGFPIGASHNMSVAANHGASSHSVQHGFISLQTAGTWAGNLAQQPAMAVRYSDGQVVGLPYTSLAAYVWNSGTNPRYRAMRWTPKVTCDVDGMWVCFRPTNTADFEISIYEGTSNDATGTYAVDPDVEMTQNTGGFQFKVIFGGTLKFIAGRTYRIVYNPTTANNQTIFAKLQLPDAGSASAWELQDFVLETTNSLPNPVVWTEQALQYIPLLPNIVRTYDTPAAMPFIN